MRTLASRIAMLAAAVAVITAVLAGVLAVSLITRANANAARNTLSRLADAAQSTAEQGASATASQARARRTLLAVKVQSVLIDAQGTVTAGSALGRAAVTETDVRTLLAGRNLSAQRWVNGDRLFVEGRPTPAGAIVLLQRRADATAEGSAAIRRTVIALAVGVAIALLLGVIFARRITGPLRRTAEAARALAHGRRDVQVNADGPVEVAEVAEAVNTLAAELTHSEGRQREFLLSVSHDLRTPMTALTGYAESLADGVVPAEDAQRVGQIMLGEAHRLNRLVSDLLDLARLGAQEFRIDLAQVDVAALARHAAPVWDQRCKAEGLRFRLEIAGGETAGVAAAAGEWGGGEAAGGDAAGGDAAGIAAAGGDWADSGASLWCVTDPSRLRQVLDGLFENALRVTPEGAPIVLAARPGAGGGVVAEVRDGGPGLTDSDLAVAFERSALYERYRGVRQVGTGLGLAIVHGLVTRLGGTVEAGHAPEGGARFTVRLPTQQG